MRIRNEAISRRVRELSPSVTLEIAARARAMRLAGEDVISLSAGELPFAPPARAIEAAKRALEDQETHRYGPAAGLPELREAVARKSGCGSGLPVRPEQVVVSNGAKEALFLAFQVLLDPGDKILLPTSYWTSYPERVRLARADPAVVASRKKLESWQ